MKIKYTIIGLILLIFLAGGSASALTWTSANGCWTATNGANNLVMWNATGNSTFAIPSGVTLIWFTVVAGGGSGGRYYGGGGGAGGVLNGTLSVTPGSIINISVGSGAPTNTATGTSGTALNGTAGNNSVFGPEIAYGGGSGGGIESDSEQYCRAGGNGGSGGGASDAGSLSPATCPGGNNVTGQGFPGGSPLSYTNRHGGSGGGGAGESGGNLPVSPDDVGAKGGNGTVISITGSPQSYGGGGGGSADTPGTGGLGGGGKGATNSVAAGAGTPGTGGGGGGGSYASASLEYGGAGGSGIVIISYTTPSPLANFTYTPVSGTTPLTVSFTDASATMITVWNWTFGAANFSSLQNPSYTFVGGGNYSVTLNVTNASGTNSTTKYVLVSSVSDPNPNSMIKYKSSQSTININNQTPYVGTGIIGNISSNTTRVISNFTWNPVYVSVSNIRLNQSSVNITGLTIDSSTIGNGYAIVNESKASGFTAPANATFDFNITYVKYAAPGTSVPFSFDSSSEYYDIRNNTYWNFNTISGANAIIGVWGPITANFTATPTTTSTGTSITFSDSSIGYPDAWSWNFGDGSTSTLQNPSYAYSAVGNYTVSETAYMSENATVTNTLTRTGYINVTAAPPPAPIAAFTGTPTTVSAGSAVQFTDQSLNSPTSWLWVFGDGNGNTQQNPSHVYSVVGNYTVNLTATNAQGSNTLSKTNYIQVVVLAPPVAGFTTNVSTGQTPLPVQFTDTSSNIPTSWLWTFGDNSSTSTSRNPTHTFTTAGNWSVTLAATNAAGTNTTTSYITARTLSGFTRQDLVMAPQYTLTVNFVDSSTLLPIPVVTVIDSNGNNATTTAGTYTGTYPYESVIIYAYATSEGYAATSASYVITGNLVETIQMTKSTTTTAVQNSNVIYTPQYYQLSIVWRNPAGVHVPNCTVNMTVIQSTLPTTSLNSTNTSLSLQEFFGINPTAANMYANGTLITSGTSDAFGRVGFLVIRQFGYNVQVTDPNGNVWNSQVFPTDPGQMDTMWIGTSSLSTATNTELNYLNGTRLWYSEPNSSYVTMNLRYQDTNCTTTDLKFQVWTTNNWTMINNQDLGNPGCNAVTTNFTVPNVRGNQYWFSYNATGY